MNKIIELHAMAKGSLCEIKGTIAYDSAPKPTRYGTGLNQFVVVEDNAEGGLNAVGVNISVASVEDGFIKGNKVIIKGKVDKYPDRKQPLQADGTYPMKTSVKAEHVEHYVEAEDFPVESTEKTPDTSSQANEMSKDDLKEAEKPAYVDGADAKQKMWEAKELKICKQACLKVVGSWVEKEVIKVKDMFKWADRLVDYVYNQDNKFALITEANLMQSGLIVVSKTEALDWIETHMKGTDVEQDICGILHVKALDKQTLNELLETIGKLSLVI